MPQAVRHWEIIAGKLFAIQVRPHLSRSLFSSTPRLRHEIACHLPDRILKEVVGHPLRFREPKSNARRLDTTLVERLKLCSMKLTQVRYFSHAPTILICCCISIAFAASAAAAQFGFPDWIELSPTNSPPARSYLAMTYDPASGKVIMFGGDSGTTYLNDTWSFDGTTWTEIATQSAPPCRAAAQMTYDSVTQR